MHIFDIKKEDGIKKIVVFKVIRPFKFATLKKIFISSEISKKIRKEIFWKCSNIILRLRLFLAKTEGKSRI